VLTASRRPHVSPGKRLAGRILGSFLGLVLMVAGLLGVVPPVLIWTHLAGTAVQVRGTAMVHHPRSVRCEGWVRPAGVAPPVRLPDDRLSWALTTTAEDRAESYRITVHGGRCLDGDYWALADGDDDVWTGSVDPSALLDVAPYALWVLLGGGLFVASWRAGRRTRDRRSTD
jgi:hypothetical protein